MVELALSVVLLVTLAVGYVRRRRTQPGMQLHSGLFVIAALAAVVPAVARLLPVNATVLHALAVTPFCAYALHGIYWLIRNRRGLAAAWRAETEDDRRRGLR